MMAKQDNEMERKGKIITMLFTAYGQGGEAERMAMYVKKLKDVPADVLDKACDKAIMESKYLPTIAELVEAAKDLVSEVNGTDTVPFAEVWEEIMDQLHQTYFDWEEGTFSRKEIKQLVDAFGGLRELRMMETSAAPVIRAQMNKMYDGICAKNKEKRTNGYVLGTTVLIETTGNRARLLK